MISNSDIKRLAIRKRAGRGSAIVSAFPNALERLVYSLNTHPLKGAPGVSVPNGWLYEKNKLDLLRSLAPGIGRTFSSEEVGDLQQGIRRVFPGVFGRTPSGHVSSKITDITRNISTKTGLPYVSLLSLPKDELVKSLNDGVNKVTRGGQDVTKNVLSELSEFDANTKLLNIADPNRVLPHRSISRNAGYYLEGGAALGALTFGSYVLAKRLIALHKLKKHLKKTHPEELGVRKKTAGTREYLDDFFGNILAPIFAGTNSSTTDAARGNSNARETIDLGALFPTPAHWVDASAPALYAGLGLAALAGGGYLGSKISDKLSMHQLNKLKAKEKQRLFEGLNREILLRKALGGEEVQGVNHLNPKTASVLRDIPEGHRKTAAGLVPALGMLALLTTAPPAFLYGRHLAKDVSREKKFSEFKNALRELNVALPRDVSLVVSEDPEKALNTHTGLTDSVISIPQLAALASNDKTRARTRQEAAEEKATRDIFSI